MSGHVTWYKGTVRKGDQRKVAVFPWGKEYSGKIGS